MIAIGGGVLLLVVTVLLLVLAVAVGLQWWPSLIIAPLIFVWMLRGAWRWCKLVAEAANSPN